MGGPSRHPLVSVRLPLCLLGSGHQNIFTQEETKTLVLCVFPFLLVVTDCAPSCVWLLFHIDAA